jgi:hypothetical protein
MLSYLYVNRFVIAQELTELEHNTINLVGGPQKKIKNSQYQLK